MNIIKIPEDEQKVFAEIYKHLNDHMYRKYIQKEPENLSLGYNQLKVLITLLRNLKNNDS